MTDTDAAEQTSPRYVQAPRYQLIVMSRLTAIAWFTGITALGTVLTAIGSLVLLSKLG